MESTTIIRYEPHERAVYTIDETARIAHVSRHSIAVYCRRGLIEPVLDPTTKGWVFDDESIRALRSVEHLRQEYGVNLAGARLMLELLEEVDRLRAEVRFLQRL